MATRAWSARRTFRNPGGAIATEAIGEAGSVAVVTTCAAMALAISSGARRYGLANFRAMLLAKSPRVASAGCSIVTAESTWLAGALPAGAGSGKLAWASCHAASMASRTWDRRLAVASGVMAEW